MAEAARVYAKRAQLGQEAIRHATEIKLRAERKAGEILRETPKNEGAKGVGKGAVIVGDRTPTLKEIGVTKNQSSRYQKLAALPAPEFEQVAKVERNISAMVEKQPIPPTRTSSATRNCAMFLL